MGLLNLRSLFEHIEQPARRTPREAAVGSLMAATRRELAVLAAEMMGAQSYLGQFGTGDGARGLPRGDRRLFRDLIENAALPSMIIDPRAGLHIVDINESYAAATLTRRGQAAGGKLFDVFPDNPELPDADGVGNLFESIQKASQTGRIHTMPVQRYDVQDASGAFVEKHWQPVNTPIFDETGRLVFVLHHAIDVAPR
jgi:hypothetical protein